MEPTLARPTAAMLVRISALGGTAMAAIRFAGKPLPPTSLAMACGLLSAAALTLMIYSACAVRLPGRALRALLFLMVAAGGGVFLNLNFHFKQLPLPKWPIMVHAGAALIGFLLLLSATGSASWV
ncbi:MAG: hypothetical protein ABIZ64_02080 [Casimicrobium sp.]